MKLHTIVIVEDYILFSQAIEGLINTFEDFKVIYTCDNGFDLLSNLQDGNIEPDIVLMGINTPAINEIEATRMLKNQYPDINVLALSVEGNEETMVSMLDAGACGFLLKEIDKETLEAALIEVMTKGCYYTKAISRILINLLNNSKITKTNLKDRELDFIKHTCSEMTYKEIAEKMFLSPKTIDGYRSDLFQKLDIRNRTGLVLYAIKNKIFTP
jgi:DNA-binding NarL/FixJ family response regulator